MHQTEVKVTTGIRTAQEPGLFFGGNPVPILTGVCV